MERPERFANCTGCGRILSNRFNKYRVCRFCGSDALEELNNPSEMELMEAETNAAEMKMHDWLDELKSKGLWGPGPSVAAFTLGCSRPMVDDLVRDKILERSDYNEQGHKLVVISLRSIIKAKAKKVMTGSYTGRPPGRPAPT